jgi:chitodextrinase
MYKTRYSLLVLILVTSLLTGAPAVSAAPLHADRGPWAPNVWYNVGDTVTYNGSAYRDLQAHTSLTGWEPPNVPALWQLVSGHTNTPSGPGNTFTPSPTTTMSRTPTRTNTPAGPTATFTRTPTLSGSSCWSAWVSSTAYTGGAQASRNGQNYQAAYWTQGNDPATNNGPAGSGQPWIPMGGCGVDASATHTRTNTPNGPTATASRTSTPGVDGFPSRVTVIYADISFTSVQAAHQATGQKYYALSFVLGNGGTCTPAWDGTHLMSENYYSSEINAIRAAGGDVIAVFGGANGSDMASVCNTQASLQAAYQAVINQYQFKWIDLNIEGGMVHDSVSVDRRNKAIKALQDANPNLKVSYTLPVVQAGLLQAELNVLSNAKANGVRIDYVNIMTMNYGPSGIDMGQAAIDAATNTRSQLVGLGIPALIGITPMIGQNNTQGEIFDLADADQLIAYAEANSYVGWLSFWSLGRDNGGCAGQTTASASCSGISQGNYAFTNKFKAFP